MRTGGRVWGPGDRMLETEIVGVVASLVRTRSEWVVELVAGRRKEGHRRKGD